MQQELSDRLGAYDQTISSDATKIKRWLNMSQSDICGMKNWPFLIADEIVQTVTDITTGTVTISDASTSLIFSSAPAVSVANRFIKFSTSNNWYKITAHTASSTSATITPALSEGGNVSAGTYTVRKLFYSTSTPLDTILDMKQFVTPAIIESIAPYIGDIFLPLYWGVGTVYRYIQSSFSSTDGLQFCFLYSPASVQNIVVRGIKKLTDMSSDSDTSLIPARWHSTILDMASYYGFSSLDDTRSSDFYNKALAAIEVMKNVYVVDGGRHRIMNPVNGLSEYGPEYTLPSNFGPMVQ